MNEITINSENIGSFVQKLREEIMNSGQNPFGSYLILNPNKIVLSKRYRGKGRPRKIDYDVVPDEEFIDALKKMGFYF